MLLSVTKYLCGYLFSVSTTYDLHRDVDGSVIHSPYKGSTSDAMNFSSSTLKCLDLDATGLQFLVRFLNRHGGF